MTYAKMLEDIESVYRYASSHPLVKKEGLVVVGHSEGSINVSRLIGQGRLRPKGLLFIGGITESPRAIFHWQVVVRPGTWLFELDRDQNQVVTNNEIEAGFSSSKLASLGYQASAFLSPSGSWTQGEYFAKAERDFAKYRRLELAKPDQEPFRLAGRFVYSQQSYWKMWFLDNTSVLDHLQNYEGPVIFMNGDIDSQTPAARVHNFLRHYKKPLRSYPVVKVYKGIGHSFGRHPLLGPVEEVMASEIEKSIREILIRQP